MADPILIYQGDTFLANGTYTDANDVPIDLVSGGITVESYVRDRNNLKIDLNVSIEGGTGEYVVSGPTDEWPLGRLTWHVRYVQGTVKKSIDPVVINVEVG